MNSSTKTSNMKKIITCIALLILANSIYSQQSKPTATMTKNDYLQKSKHQKTAAWLFMGGGLGLTIGGLCDNSSDNFNKGDNTGKMVAIIAGVAAISVGTTFFITSANNKKKAESLSFRMERAPLMQQGNFVYRSYPALSFRLNL
jgi:hypothetical protein